MGKDRRKSLLLLLALLVVCGVRWWGSIATDDTLPDEAAYVRAAGHLAAGASPYDESKYFYPPPLARTLAATIAEYGRPASLRLLRGLSLTGIAVAVWWLLLGTAWSWWIKLGIGAAFLTLAPAVAVATTLGNAAGLAVGPALVALTSWSRRPALAGSGLGLALAVKPVAILAPALILFHRSASVGGRRRVAAVSACLVAGVLACLADVERLPDLLRNARGTDNPYNFSLHSIVRDLGLDLPPVTLLVAVTLAAVVWSRRRPRSSHELTIAIVTASLLGLPILWAHSLLLALPLQVATVETLSRWKPHPDGGRAVVAQLLAGLALAATLLPQAVGTGAGLPEWAALVARSTTLLAVPYLAWFLLRAAPPPLDALHSSGDRRLP